MASLTTSMKKFGADVSEADRAAIYSASRAFRARGMFKADASRAAVKKQLDCVAALLAEQLAEMERILKTGRAEYRKIVASRDGRRRHEKLDSAGGAIDQDARAALSTVGNVTTLRAQLAASARPIAKLGLAVAIKNGRIAEPPGRTPGADTKGASFNSLLTLERFTAPRLPALKGRSRAG